MWTISNLCIVQCVHKVPSGFWKIVARKQIELSVNLYETQALTYPVKKEDGAVMIISLHHYLYTVLMRPAH
jgi:hypothetical protein